MTEFVSYDTKNFIIFQLDEQPCREENNSSTRTGSSRCCIWHHAVGNHDFWRGQFEFFCSRLNNSIYVHYFSWHAFRCTFHAKLNYRPDRSFRREWTVRNLELSVSFSSYLESLTKPAMTAIAKMTLSMLLKGKGKSRIPQSQPPCNPVPITEEQDRVT